MAPDQTAITILAIAERGRPRGAESVLSAARRDAESVPLTLSTPVFHRRGRRVLQVALIVLVTAAIGLALVATGVLPGRHELDRAAHSILGQRSPLDEQLDEWLAGYDPAERQYLRDNTPEDFGEVSKQYEVGTLEFRRTCRKMAAAIDATTGQNAEEGAAAVWAIMGPQLDRYDERDRLGTKADGQEPITGQPGSMSYAWRQLTEQLAAGDRDPAQQFTDRECGDALGPWIDE